MRGTHGQREEGRDRTAGYRQPRVACSKVRVCVEDACRRRLRDLKAETSANARSRGFVMLVRVAMIAAHHRRSLHRARAPCNLADLTRYEARLLTSLGELAVEALKPLVLDVQDATEGVEAFERSALKPVL